MEMGFGMVNVIDPAFGRPAPLLGNFLYFLALVIFLTVDGHLLVLRRCWTASRRFPRAGGAGRHRCSPPSSSSSPGSSSPRCASRCRWWAGVPGDDGPGGSGPYHAPAQRVMVGLALKIVLGLAVIALVLPALSQVFLDGIEVTFTFVRGFVRGLGAAVNMAGVGGVINLQLFAEERQFPATPRRRQEARRRGQVFRSMELSSAAILMGGLAALQFFGSATLPTWAGCHEALSTWTRIERPRPPSPGRPPRSSGPSCWRSCRCWWSWRCWAWRSTPPRRAWPGPRSRCAPAQPHQPLEGAKRIFSRRALFELGKSLVKVALVGAVTARPSAAPSRRWWPAPAPTAPTLASTVGGHALALGWRAAVALLVAGGLGLPATSAGSTSRA